MSNKNIKDKHPEEKSDALSAKLLTFIIVAIVVIVAAALVIMSFSSGNSDNGSVNLYFVNQATGQLSPQKARLDTSGDERDVMRNLLDLLLAGPTDPASTASVPSSVKFLSGVITTDHVAVINLSSDYYDLSIAEELNCRAAFVWTLTELDFIENVRIMIEENELTTAVGVPLGNLNRSNIIISAELPNVKTERKIIKCYFSNADGSALVAEEREIEVNPKQPRERDVWDIVSELIKGAEVSGHISLVAPEARINDISVEDGVCFVDFSKEFMERFSGGSGKEYLMIYSIVNSLTEISTIGRVQILIDGNRVAAFKEQGFDLSNPIDRNPDIIEEQ